jgi:hypothetical protein
MKKLFYFLYLKIYDLMKIKIFKNFKFNLNSFFFYKVNKRSKLNIFINFLFIFLLALK